MELAGLSVAQTVYKVHPIDKGKRILVLAGPGNNGEQFFALFTSWVANLIGGDGLVAARHLFLMGYQLQVYYPKKSRNPHLQRLEQQLLNLGIPVLETTEQVTEQFKIASHIVDALFGFSFKPPIRPPFDEIIELLRNNTSGGVPVTAVDVPSSWDVDQGPGSSGGKVFQPDVLVSLTCPKPASQFFKGRHFLGGKFVSQEFAEKWGFELPKYPGLDQVVEID